jgi:hypothetical protein
MTCQCAGHFDNAHATRLLRIGGRPPLPRLVIRADRARYILPRPETNDIIFAML